MLQYHGTCFGGENWYFQRGEVRTCLPCHVHLSKFGGTTDEPSSSEGAFDVLPTDMYVKCRGLLWQRAQAVRKHSSVPVPVQHSYYGGTNKNSRSQNHTVLLICRFTYFTGIITSLQYSTISLRYPSQSLSVTIHHCNLQRISGKSKLCVRQHH